MTRTTTSLLALITAANLAFAGGGAPPQQDPPAPVKVDADDTEVKDAQGAPPVIPPVSPELEGAPQDGPLTQSQVPTDLVGDPVESVDEDVADDETQEDDGVRTVKGTLKVERSHDTITMTLNQYMLNMENPLPLSALAGREVELVVKRGRRGQAEVLSTVSPRGWSGTGVVRNSANGLHLITSSEQLKIAGLPEGVASRIENRQINASGWVFPGNRELVFSGASARIVVATDKAGNATEGAYLNERTVDVDGKATYAKRHYLNPGDEVKEFDLAAYRKAKRDDDGEILESGVWRPSLNAMVGGDILLARTTVNQREGNGITGWIPLRKLSFGEVAPADAPTEVDVTIGQGQPVQDGGLTGAVDLTAGDDVDAVQSSLEDAIAELSDDPTTPAVDTNLDDLVEALESGADATDLTLDPSAGEPVPTAAAQGQPQDQPQDEAPVVDAPLVDLDLGAPIARTAMVTATELNVRTQADHRSPELLVALHGESVKILENDPGSRFVKVELAPPSGYVYHRHLVPTGEQTGKVRTFKVGPSHLKLRENAGEGDNVACFLIGGQEVQAVGAKKGWIKIQQSEPVVGYVVRSALNLE